MKIALLLKHNLQLIKTLSASFTQINPRLFSNFGKPLPIINAMTPTLQINLLPSKDFSKEIKQSFLKIEFFLKEKNQISLKIELENCLDLMVSHQNFLKEMSSKLDNFRKLSTFFQQNLSNLTFYLQKPEKTSQIMSNFIEFFLSLNYYNYTEKTLLLDFCTEFLEILFKKLETHVYILMHNQNIPFFDDIQDLDLSLYRSAIANKSTLSFYIDQGFIPKEILRFLTLLTEEKKRGGEIYQEKISKFFDKFTIFFQNNEDLSLDLGSDKEKILIELKKFKNFHEFNEMFYHTILFNDHEKIMSEYKLIDQITTFLMHNFQKILKNSSLQTIIFFCIITLRDKGLSRNNLIFSQIFRYFHEKITNFSEFLTIFSTIIMKNYSATDDILKEFYQYSLTHKYSLNSLEILQFIKIAKNFYIISHENHYIFNLITSIDDVLRKNADLLSINQKFEALCMLESLDIPEKIKLNNEILQNINKCPVELLSKIIVHFCDFSYNLIDFKELEKLVEKHYDSFDIFEKMIIYKSFIYHIKGSQGFINNFLQDMVKTLNFEDHMLFKETSPLILCYFYQIIFTLKNFYKGKYPLLADENIKEWYQGFQRKYEQINQPFYPRKIAFSKEEFEFEMLLKEMGVKFVKEKKILLHKVDFLVENRLCLELQGRHHFASKFIVDGKTKWKERNLKKKSGLAYKAISLEKWKSYSEERKLIMIQKILAK